MTQLCKYSLTKNVLSHIITRIWEFSQSNVPRGNNILLTKKCKSNSSVHVNLFFKRKIDTHLQERRLFHKKTTRLYKAQMTCLNTVLIVSYLYNLSPTFQELSSLVLQGKMAPAGHVWPRTPTPSGRLTGDVTFLTSRTFSWKSPPFLKWFFFVH